MHIIYNYTFTILIKSKKKTEHVFHLEMQLYRTSLLSIIRLETALDMGF